jgi:nitroimidazol reductase NimA-like FMN-containing flavoprotein (pyridoxamine 5'-phosphate oxidase superfamily)
LDATPLCNVGCVFNDHPYVTPTMHWREGNDIFWHGSSASQMLRATNEAKVCLTVSIVDGFVMARSGMNHSTNYRSVMLFGAARKVEDPAEKEARLKTFVDGMFPGRWDILRPVTDQELKATTVLTMPIDEGSSKVRAGPPGDDEEDYGHPIWAGVIPLQTEVLAPVDDPRNLPGMTPPDHILNFKFGK